LLFLRKLRLLGRVSWWLSWWRITNFNQLALLLNFLDGLLLGLFLEINGGLLFEHVVLFNWHVFLLLHHLLLH
jgi:hypothetical protein